MKATIKKIAKLENKLKTVHKIIKNTKMTQATLNIISHKIDEIHEDIKEIKNDVKENTKFRYQTKGTIRSIMVVSGVLFSGIMWVMYKLGGGGD